MARPRLALQRVDGKELEVSGFRRVSLFMERRRIGSMKFRLGTMTFLAASWGDLTKDFYTVTVDP